MCVLVAAAALLLLLNCCMLLFWLCRWAQELGGVDVLASLPSSVTGADTSQMLSALSAYRSALRLETFVDRVVQAKTGRQELK